MLNRWQHQGLFGETFIRVLASAADWSYPMRVEHFNELAGTDYSLPRFLLVVNLVTTTVLRSRP